MDWQRYNKAYVPIIVALVLGLLGMVGITGDMRVEDAIIALVTAGIVYWVPNKQA